MKAHLLLFSLLVVSICAEEKWSWGTANSNREGRLVSISKDPPTEKVTAAAATKPVVVVSQKATDPKSQPRQSRKVEVVKGKSEARFFKLKEKMCEYGIGFDCKKGYDYDLIDYVQEPILIEEPYQQPVGYHQPAPSYSGGINPQSLIHVQPVALQAVGGPIQAVPLGGGHAPPGAYSAHSQGGYGGHVQGSYSAPGPISESIQSSGYDHSASTLYGAPQPSYSPPVYQSPDSKDASFGVNHVPSGVVKHYHTHTHVYQGDRGRIYDHNYSGSHSNPSFSSSSSSSLPIIPPSHFGRESCECVPISQCSSNDIMRRSKSLPTLDARSKKTDILSNATDSASEKLSRKRRQLSNTYSEDTQGRQFGSSNECRFNEVCCSNPRRSRSSRHSTCGRRNANGILGRVKNNHFQEGDADFAEYPWQAAVLKAEGREAVYVCAAALIDQIHLLTAAHCVKGLKPSNLLVRLGEWNVHHENEFYPHTEIPVSDITIHPKFYAGLLTNDIAVMRLQYAVNMKTNPHISPVCLPDTFADFTGRRCHVSGWGKDAFGREGDFQNVLKEVDLPVVDHYVCQTSLRQTRLGRDFDLDDGMLCAGGEEGRDACKGDGGGPLVCADVDGSFQLAGLVSWGVGCGERGVPGVYVNIPKYVDWIRSIARL